MKVIITSIIFVSLSWSQITIEGSVYNSATNDPISNANIIVLGTSDGSATTNNGIFQITTDAQLPVQLAVSHIAYKSQLINITSLTTLRILLDPAVIQSDEVSVTGKYSRAEQEVSSSIKSLTLEEMETIGASDVSDALRTLSSTNIEQAGGGRQTISIRGSNPNEVSVYLDGIRLNDAYTNTANIAAIDQNDLSSIEILKGGNTTLFSNGNFGGIVFLNTQLPDSSELKFARGFGLQDEKNQDLSFGASGRFGSVALGGRYSGKSRRYHGRTTYTTIFQNLAFSTFPDNGTLDIKAYYLEDYLTLPTEAVVQSAKTQLGMIRYKGNFSRSPNWELFTSAKLWNWDDDFFSNLTRTINDEIITARIGKGFNTSKLRSMLNYEYENQKYSANNNRIPIDSGGDVLNYISSENGELNRVNNSLSGVLQFKSSVNNTVIQQLLWELGFRADDIKTSHLQTLETQYDFSEVANEISNLDTSFDDFITGFKAGVNASGKTNQLQYKFFLNQGRSSRLPTLNDIYLSNGSTIDFNLGQEKLYSSEFGIEVGNNGLDYNSSMNSYVVTGGFFINNYSNKIAYQFRENAPPLPYNIDLAKISGFDINFSSSLFNNMLRLNSGYQKINVDNPVIFPNKPSSRFTAHAELGYKFLSLGYDYFKEGSQFIVYNGFVGNSLEGRENTNVSLIFRHKIWKAHFSLNYVIHNVYSNIPVIADPDVNYLSPFNFFDVHRQILTLKIKL